jgi:hypothetical protein
MPTLAVPLERVTIQPPNVDFQPPSDGARSFVESCRHPLAQIDAQSAPLGTVTATEEPR